MRGIAGLQLHLLSLYPILATLDMHVICQQSIVVRWLVPHVCMNVPLATRLTVHCFAHWCKIIFVCNDIWYHLHV